MPRAPFAFAFVLLLTPACSSPTASNPTLLTANIVDPESVNAVSTFNSCAGHAYPEQNSPNSGKNYFWPNSTNFSTINILKLFAACDGTVGQARDDTDANEQDRGQTFHLYCDNSSTSLRYFHLNINSGISGHHVSAGDFIGFAAMLGTGQGPSMSWRFSSNFDIAVSEHDDSHTENYFSKLNGAAFAAWSARGVSAIGQTVTPGNPSCPTFTSNIGDAGILSFSPAR